MGNSESQDMRTIFLSRDKKLLSKMHYSRYLNAEDSQLLGVNVKRLFSYLVYIDHVKSFPNQRMLPNSKHVAFQFEVCEKYIRSLIGNDEVRITRESNNLLHRQNSEDKASMLNSGKIPMQPLVGILLRQWDNFELTDTCLDELTSLPYQNIKFYLIDDGSRDDSYIKLWLKYPEVNIYRLEERREYTACFNSLAKRATVDECKYIFIINNDTKKFSAVNKGEDFLSATIMGFDDQSDFIVSPNVKNYDGATIHSHSRRKLGIYFPIATEGYLIKLQYWDLLGGFNNKLVRYCEDLELLRRSYVKELQSKTTSEAYFYHLGNGSSRKQLFTPTFFRVRNGIWILKSNKLHGNKSISVFSEFTRWLKPHLNQIFSDFRSRNILDSVARLIYLLLGVFAGIIFSLKRQREVDIEKVFDGRVRFLLSIDHRRERRYWRVASQHK